MMCESGGVWAPEATRWIRAGLRRFRFSPECEVWWGAGERACGVPGAEWAIPTMEERSGSGDWLRWLRVWFSLLLRELNSWRQPEEGVWGVPLPAGEPPVEAGECTCDPCSECGPRDRPGSDEDPSGFDDDITRGGLALDEAELGGIPGMPGTRATSSGPSGWWWW